MKETAEQFEPGRYKDAVIGFRNHWYPAMRSQDIVEDEIKPLMILGEDVLFKRIDGQVYAIRNSCAHRGYRFSEKVECYTRNTITCPVHAFTYNFRNGELVTIPSDPQSPLIGRTKVHAYPIEEINDLIFVFIGDILPPPLAHDVPPRFLEKNLFVVAAVNVDCDCNWRIAADSGFDPNHIFLHKENDFLKELQMPFPIATRLKNTDTFGEIELIEGDGPKGLTDRLSETEPVYEHVFECDGETGRMASMFPPDGEDGQARQGFGAIEGSLWMPGVLNVNPWPIPGMTHFEWWVPIDETTHRYFIAWGKLIDRPDEQESFRADVESKWINLGYENFNRYDVLLNNGMQAFYSDPDRAYGEGQILTRNDGYIIAWHRLATKHNRGIQLRYAGK
jgi:carbazole 1,9a-dioxygenase